MEKETATMKSFHGWGNGCSRRLKKVEEEEDPDTRARAVVREEGGRGGVG